MSAAVIEANDVLDLELDIITELPTPDTIMACTTNDGCKPTCASSCVSGSA